MRPSLKCLAATLPPRSGPYACDSPICEDASAAAAGYPEFLLVDVATLNEFVDTDHQIAIVVARVVILNDIAELLAVAGRPARVDVEDDVTFGGHPLKFMIEDPSVGSVRTAMDVENERVLLLRIEVGRLLDPALNAVYPVAVGMYPIRSSCRYLKNMHGINYLRHGRDIRGRMVYRLSPRGARWLFRDRHITV
jgi:hypothetical protein